MDNKPLAHKVAVVTGASRGLGKAVAQHLASLGANLVLIGRTHDTLAAAAADIEREGTTVIPVTCDISNPDTVQETAAFIVARMSRVDILVNNAGIPAPRTFAETDFNDWQSVIGTNLNGVFYLTRALWTALTASDGGYVVTISGTAGQRGGGSPAYGAAKFGLTGLNHAIATAGKAHNVRATVLYPGSMDTGWRGAPIGEKPRSESMDPAEVARFVGHLVTSPRDFVVNEASLNPLSAPLM
ncbi:MAG: SDR family oxidoreductase [Pleurocapsa minor GSE-CHR-MK-17-07R]|jgi:3-oxoacyl-[acyl-carrier protein] reductase|nr:SDR family oxidoreductase [Pleurocapsa minor GSE-CHR-MK 17-07R]